MKPIRYCILCLMALLSQIANAATSYQYLDIDQGRLAYRVFGAGRPLIVINGGPGRSSQTFVPLAEKLSEKNLKVILFDQRGTGQSTLKVVDSSTITMSHMVRDLESLRTHLHLPKLSILGHSFGGMYAMSYAAQYPNKVEALILSASGGIDLSWQQYTRNNMLVRLSEDAKERYQHWTSDEQIARDPLTAALESLRVLLPAYVYDQKFVPEIEQALINLEYYFPEVNRLVWDDLKKSNYSLEKSFRKFKAPTLILAGRQDFLGEAVPLRIQANIAGSKLEFLDKCSHYPWLDQPKSYFSFIDAFLNP